MNTFELKNAAQNLRGIIQTENGNEKPELSANALQTMLERVYGIHVSVKDFQGGDSSCALGEGRNRRGKNQTVSFYVRVSAFSYNTVHDFQRFHNVLHHNISITDHIKRNSVVNFPLHVPLRNPPRLSKLQQVVRTEFLLSFERYHTLFDTLEIKALFIRAEKLRHHLIFYFGHTAVFYINKLISGGFLQSSHRVDPHFESVFAIGVDEMTWDDTLTENYDWCGFLNDDVKLKEYYGRVKDYRQQVSSMYAFLLI